MTDAEQVPEDAGGDLEFDAPDDPTATIVTKATPIRATLRLPTMLVDEAKLRFRDDGIGITAVDPANVGMVDLDVHADGFIGYQGPGDDAVAGVPFGTFTDALSFARMTKDDPVRIDFLDDSDTPRMRVEVIRPDQQMKRVSVFSLIDPDSIRQEPDIPDLVLPFRATPGIDPLRDAVESLNSGYDHAGVAIDGSALVVGSTYSTDVNLSDSRGDTRADTAVFPNAAWVDDGHDEDAQGQGSLFSLDYLRDMTKALKRSKMDRVTLKFGVEFPTMLDFDKPDWNVSGKFMLAPRIQSD